MHGIRAHLTGRAKHRFHIQIGGGAGALQRRVALHETQVRRARIVAREQAAGDDAGFTRGPRDAHGNFAAIGNQQFAQGDPFVSAGPIAFGQAGLSVCRASGGIRNAATRSRTTSTKQGTLACGPAAPPVSHIRMRPPCRCQKPSFAWPCMRACPCLRLHLGVMRGCGQRGSASLSPPPCGSATPLP